MSKESFLDPNKFILDQLIAKLKEHFESGNVTSLEIKRYIYEVLLEGFQRESHEFLADFFKSKVPSNKRDKTKWSLESWSDFYKKLKRTNLGLIQNSDILEFGNDLLGNDFLRRHENLLIQGINTSEGVDSRIKMYLRSMAGLVYFQYFQAINAGLIDKEQISSSQLMTLPEEVRLRELAWIKDGLKSQKPNILDKGEAWEDFYNTYPPGEYNVEFIEEGSTVDCIKFAVSRLVITESSIIHYYQLLRSGRFERTEHKVRPSSNNHSFHLYEIDSKWGYRFSVPRFDSNDGEDNFWILYEGIREKENTRILGVGIARRIFPEDDPILPIRMVQSLNSEHLRVVADVEAVTRQLEKSRETEPVREVYQSIFNEAPKISSKTEGILSQVTQLLTEKGVPIEVNDKAGIRFD